MRRLGGRLPGNVVVRRQRQRPETVRVEVRRPRNLAPRPWMVPAAFALVIGWGALLLSLPIASESGDWTSGWDALFTSTSAVCVTGLTRFDTAEHFSFFGELVIAVLIQLGGLGVTMYAGMLILLIGGQFGLRGREFFGIELMGVAERDVRRLLRRVALFAVATELGTFTLLLPWSLTERDPASALWHSVFHAISAFNNAGFDLMGGQQSFANQIDAPYPIVVMGIAAFLGSLSFITVFDMRHRPKAWTLDTRLVAIGMFSLLAVGMLVFLLAEVQSGRVLEGRNPIELLANAFFLSVNRTTGMSTVDMGALQDANVVILMVLMFIGGSSTSVAGGIKMGTFMVSVVVVASGLRGRHRAQVFGREIPQATVLRSMTVILLGLLALAIGMWFIELTDDGPFLVLLFEVTSALANVGWSQGITGELSTAGAVVLTVLMFVGRLGSLVVALSIPDRPQERYRYSYGRVRIG